MEDNKHHRCSVCLNFAIRKCSQCKLRYYCSLQCQKRDWKLSHKELCLPFRALDRGKAIEILDSPNSKVEVRSSSTHGRGVFATHDILKGERICFFDGEIQNAQIKIRMSKNPETSLFKIVNATEIFDIINKSLTFVNSSFHLGNSSQILVGSPEIRDPLGVGQYINDAFSPSLKNLNVIDSQKDLEDYVLKSIKGSNARIEDSGPWFIASKNIGKSSEIHIHYGVHFWLHKYFLEASNSLNRFMLYALQDQSTKPFDLTRFVEYDDETCIFFLKSLIKMKEINEEAPKETLFKLADLINLLPK